MKTLITHDIELAKQQLERGEVIGIPTESVYGLGANALHGEAVARIYKLKQRPESNPLILHVENLQKATPYFHEFHDELMRLYEVFCPGPLTFLVPKSNLVPAYITAGSPLVAIRFPSHPLFQALLSALEFPIAAPSANKYGSISATQAEQVRDSFMDEIPLVLDGGTCTFGLESTIVGMKDDAVVVYRLGSIDLDTLAVQLGYIPKLMNQATDSPVAPGMVKFHYAPDTPLFYMDKHLIPQENTGYIFLKDIPNGFPEAQCIALSKDGELKEIGRNLYSVLRAMDKRGYRCLYIERPMEKGLGLTIIDRLNRATAKFSETKK